MSRLVVISNRVAVPKARGVAGAQGGLAGALNAALKDRGGRQFRGRLRGRPGAG